MGKKEITNDFVLANVQQKIAMYDKNGEQHYDIASALIKSIRGSDPNGAVYWLARMIEGGEDAKFIARRLLISASEDIGNANPTALIMANSCFDAVSKIGWPESRIILSQCAIYLASSSKSNASYEAIGLAQSIIKNTGDLEVPLHLRNAPTKLMKDLGYGKEYAYSHTADANELHKQEFLPKELEGKVIYQPKNNQREQDLKKYLNFVWKGKYGY
jgi:putative ATPase